MRLLSVTVMAGVLVAAGAASAGDWPVFRGPDRNGISKETAWASKWDGTPKTLWSAPVGDGFSGVTVAAGKAYTMGHKDGKDTVWCFDALKGTMVWKQSYDAIPRGSTNPDYNGPRATPTIDGAMVYTFSRDGQVFCFDAAEGNVKWSVDVKKEYGYDVPAWGFAASPLVMGQMLLINAGSSGLALDKATGKTIWSSPKGVGGYNTPVVYVQGGKPRLAFSNGEAILSVDPASGKVAWKFPWTTSYKVNSADLIISDGKLFASSGYRYGCALLDINTDEPKQLWKNALMRNHFHTCVLLDGYLYGVDGDQQKPDGLKCMDLKTGEVKWQEPSVKYGGLVVADGKLIILTEQGELVVAAASSEKYAELARAKVLDGVSWTAPVLANGRVYVRNRTGQVACIDLSAPAQAAAQ